MTGARENRQNPTTWSGKVSGSNRPSSRGPTVATVSNTNSNNTNPSTTSTSTATTTATTATPSAWSKNIRGPGGNSWSNVAAKRAPPTRPGSGSPSRSPERQNKSNNSNGNTGSSGSKGQNPKTTSISSTSFPNLPAPGTITPGQAPFFSSLPDLLSIKYAQSMSSDQVLHYTINSDATSGANPSKTNVAARSVIFSDLFRKPLRDNDERPAKEEKIRDKEKEKEKPKERSKGRAKQSS